VTPIQRPAAAQDAIDRSDRWHRGNTLIQKVLSNDIGTDRSEVALGQIPPSLHHAIFDRRRRAVGRVWGGRSIGPIDPIQTLAVGPLDPEGDRGDADVELLSHCSQRLPAANRRYHVPTLLQLTLCLLKAVPPGEEV
jgi:hypothetical protein